MVIKEIHIRNFRSILKADIVLNDLSIFVGLNDVGKSNVLKALNLFFNGESDYGKVFNFNDDYCKHTPARKNKANEIIIEIIFQPPPTYAGGKNIKFTKVWRSYGLHWFEKKFVDGKKFPERSRLHSWIQNIKFSYIPAIRDTSYFQLLLVNLHDSLAATIEKELRDAGDDFIGKIKSNTESMIIQINRRLNIDSQIRLPSNLQSLFRTLDFSTTEGDFQVSLSNRGDGIKTRHIPVILKFIADQLNINRRKGSPNVNMIWGYEEPENNLEMLAAFNLAKEFIDYSNSIQILLTTHSPGFYTLKEDFPEKINLFKVNKNSGRDAEVKIIDSYSELHEDMGIMPLIAPYVKDKVNEIKELQNNINEYKSELARFKKHVIFVEGDDEVRIFTKILELKKVQDKIFISSEGFGCTGVKNKLMAWSWVSGLAKYKAVGFFDYDIPGTEALNKLKIEKQYIEAESKRKVKSFQFKTPPHLTNVKSKINNFPIEIEEVYPPAIWEFAKSKNYLEDRTFEELQGFVRVDNANQTVTQKIDSIGLSDTELLYVKSKIPDKHKDKISKHIQKLHSDEFSQTLEPLIMQFVETIIPFLVSE